jgi:hypothetical protein
MKSPSTKNNPRICKECGAQVAPRAEQCWCCRRIFSKEEIAGGDLAAGKMLHENAGNIQARVQRLLGIAFALLITTVAEVLLFGFFLKEPGLGIALAILLTPALIRAAILAIQAKSQVKPLTVSGKILVIYLWVMLGGTILVAAGITYLLTCKMSFH